MNAQEKKAAIQTTFNTVATGTGIVVCELANALPQGKVTSSAKKINQRQCSLYGQLLSCNTMDRWQGFFLRDL